jgi:hypothetical protein
MQVMAYEGMVTNSMVRVSWVRGTLALAVVLLLVFSARCLAGAGQSAQPLGPVEPGSRHAVASNDSATLDGGYFDVIIQALNAKWDSNNKSRFVAHTMWIATGTNGEWIENGFMDGGHYKGGSVFEYHKGFYNG